MSRRPLRAAPAAPFALLAMTALALVVLPNDAGAQEEKSYPRVGIGGNVGFQALGSSVGLFELGMDIPVYLNENVSVGPWLQLGVGENTISLLFSANVRYRFDFMERTRFNRIEPFVQGGLGLAYSKLGAVSATDFAMNMGFGAEAPITDHVYLGSDLMFTPVPTRQGAGSFIFTWQFLTVRYRF